MRRGRSFYDWSEDVIKEAVSHCQIAIKSICIASQDYVGDYISIETELSKWE